jgi:hypothetical protein
MLPHVHEEQMIAVACRIFCNIIFEFLLIANQFLQTVPFFQRNHYSFQTGRRPFNRIIVTDFIRFNSIDIRNDIFINCDSKLRLILFHNHTIISATNSTVKWSGFSVS